MQQRPEKCSVSYKVSPVQRAVRFKNVQACMTSPYLNRKVSA
jgi:hypothetical protein